ncbi:MAG: hypothetical protein AAF664_09730 [Planctomycetota bacterium]
MYWFCLIVLNVPVYLAIGWLLFDSKSNAADTFFDTTVAVMKAILIPRIVRVLLEIDDDDALGLFEIGIFFISCIAITYGEHYLLSKHVFA